MSYYPKRKKIYEKFDGHCAYCGVLLHLPFPGERYPAIEYWGKPISFPENLPLLCVDHIIPRCKGGTDFFENLNPSCEPCNLRKSIFTLEVFKKRLGFYWFYFEAYNV